MKYNKCLLVLSALAAVAFTGCKNEDVEKHRFDNKFYITSTILSDDLLIKSDTPGYTRRSSRVWPSLPRSRSP